MSIRRGVIHPRSWISKTADSNINSNITKLLNSRSILYKSFIKSQAGKHLHPSAPRGGPSPCGQLIRACSPTHHFSQLSSSLSNPFDLHLKPTYLTKQSIINSSTMAPTRHEITLHPGYYLHLWNTTVPAYKDHQECKHTVYSSNDQKITFPCKNENNCICNKDKEWFAPTTVERHPKDVPVPCPTCLTEDLKQHGNKRTWTAGHDTTQVSA